MITVNITYDIVSPESAMIGDFEESGFEKQNIEFDSKEEALEYFSHNYGCYEKGNETSFYTVDADQDYKNGNETYYGLHITELTADQIKFNKCFKKGM